MLVVDTERSETGRKRRRENGLLVHCCCICGTSGVWTDAWSAYYSIKELDDEVPIPKFCSEPCRAKGGPRAANVTAAMKQTAKDAEHRDPITVWREATEREKYNAAFHAQNRPARHPPTE